MDAMKPSIVRMDSRTLPDIGNSSDSDKTNHENESIRLDTSSRCERVCMDGALGTAVRLVAGAFQDASE